MTPGTILFDNDFEYSDGSRGKKLLIALNDGSTGYYITIKTTSQPKFKGLIFGCQSSDRYPNFFLPKGCCYLRDHTWALLDQFFELDMQELFDRRLAGKLNTLASLPDAILTDLLECAIDCDDISQTQAQILATTLKELRSK